MNCPHCGVAAPSGAGRCSVCNRALQSAGQVAAGVLTPLPTPASVEGGTELPGLTGSLTQLGETPAGFVLHSVEPDAPTGFVPRAVEPDAPTEFVPRSIQPDALTGFGPGSVDADLAAETPGPVAPRSEETSGTGHKGPLVV